MTLHQPQWRSHPAKPLKGSTISAA
jgi:hypothetical protein